MYKKPLTLWRVLIYFILAYSLIYAIPSSIMTTLAARNTNKQVEIFNDDGKVVDEFSHAFVNENLKDHLPYDYKILEKLCAKFELDSEDSIEKSKQKNGHLWREYTLGIVLHQLVERLAHGIINHNVWNGLIFYLIMVIIGILITLLIYRKEPAKFFRKVDPLEWIRKKLQVDEIPFTFIIMLTVIITIFGITMALSHYNFNFNEIINDDLKAEIVVFVLFIIFQCFIFLLFQITKHIKHSRSLKAAKIFDSLTSFLVIIIGFILIIPTATNLIDKLYSTFTSASILLSSKIIPYANSYRFVAYGLVVLSLVLLVIGFIYMIIKFITKKDQDLRINYLVQFSVIIFVLFAFLRILSSQTNTLESMVNNQHWNSKRSNRASLLMKLDAEVYQWYNQQIDAKRSIAQIPIEFIDHLAERDDFDFSYNWDGTLFETNIRYPQDDGVIKSIQYNLDVIKGTQKSNVTDEEIKE